ncbi:signal peptidase I [Tepidibacter hydrothermalis]|uniref:Signal peptidase I n=1 Tax=Tepidibacter hydrothermalis TaxID=3036126 RepID=A0ABY8E9A3_9FIRM|nr:signal peptidase I [Tepidibacter hydrothermalis]WFD09503.1 signal peptidase I [Tepidibacter hydrothermalis]
MSNIKYEILEWIKTISVSIVLAFVITMFIRPTIVQGQSMNPTLEDKDYLIIDKVSYRLNEPSRGDVIVFNSELTTEKGKKKHLVKRVVATGGDNVKVCNGKVYVNEKIIEEGYINGDNTDGDLEVKVPNGYVFVLGDNRLPYKSVDSRSELVGFVDEDQINGRVLIRLYPFYKIKLF